MPGGSFSWNSREARAGPRLLRGTFLWDDGRREGAVDAATARPKYGPGRPGLLLAVSPRRGLQLHLQVGFQRVFFCSGFVLSRGYLDG